MLIETCLNCKLFFTIHKIYKDSCGYYVICPECNNRKYIVFGFECNISKKYKNENCIDDWGCAYAWYEENIGVEYNFCIDNGENYSAIYKLEFNDKTGCMETVTNKFKHYKIDFNDSDWKNKLEQEMYKVLETFINEEIGVD